MQWLRVYDNTPIKTELSDKYAVRKWVEEKIGEEYLVPLHGVYDNFDDIDFKTLPQSFVIKATHGCGYNIIVKDKTTLDIQSAKMQMNTWLSENYAYFFGEYQYKDIKPRIIVEKYIEEMAGDISDYKYFCFNGKPAYVLYCFDRISGVLKNSFFDLNWKNKKFNYTGELFTQELPAPKNLPLMTELAQKLSANFKHVRVDLYNINGTIYFGEMTFTAYGGYFHFNPNEWDKKLGDLLKL